MPPLWPCPPASVPVLALDGRRNFLGSSINGTRLPPQSLSFAAATSKLFALLFLLNIGISGVFTMLAQLSPAAGDNASRPSERGERKAALAAIPEKSVLCGLDLPVAESEGTTTSCAGEFDRSAT